MGVWFRGSSWLKGNPTVLCAEAPQLELRVGLEEGGRRGREVGW